MVMSNQGTTNNSVDGQETRRLACDRCRSQKLKCVRTELSGTCQRCRTAKTSCSFGRPLPSGRPPTVGPFTRESGVNNRMPSTAIFRQSELTASILSPEPQPNPSDKHNNQRRTSLNHPVDVVYAERPWSQSSNLDDDDFFNVLNDDTVMGDIDDSTFGIWSTAPDKPHEDSSPRQTIERPGHTGGNLTHLTNANISATSTDPHMLSQTHRPDMITHTTLDKRHVNGSTSSSKRSIAQVSTSASDKSWDSPATKHPPALMQKLMQLGSVMYELQSVYSPDEHGSRPETAPSNTFPVELAGKVLQVATEFLKSLRCSFSPDDSSFSSSNTSSIRRRGPSMSDLGDIEDRNYPRGVGQYQAFPDTISHPSSAYTSSSSSLHTPTDWPSRRVLAAAKPTTLQLIANYLGLLQLYLLLYNAVYDYARFTESDFRQSQPIWKDLTIGDAPLYHFADIQIKMVLQVAARLLEDIEAALGLTENCRVSKKSATEGSGILGMNVTAHFIEMCMSEVATGPEPGKGTVARLRDIMHCLMNILDAPVYF